MKFAVKFGQVGARFDSVEAATSDNEMNGTGADCLRSLLFVLCCAVLCVWREREPCSCSQLHVHCSLSTLVLAAEAHTHSSQSSFLEH